MGAFAGCASDPRSRRDVAGTRPAGAVGVGADGAGCETGIGVSAVPKAQPSPWKLVEVVVVEDDENQPEVRPHMALRRSPRDGASEGVEEDGSGAR